jgi:hypothetical protein
MTHAPDRPSTPTIPAILPADVLRQLAVLHTAPTTDLKERWRQLFGREPPPFNRSYLRSRLIHKVQALVYGDLKPTTVARLEALGEKLDGGNITLRRVRADDRPVVGTQLVREWNGVRHVITVRATDFDFEGQPFKSLSAIARHITGTRWNGWTFFGLRARSGA